MTIYLQHSSFMTYSTAVCGGHSTLSDRRISWSYLLHAEGHTASDYVFRLPHNVILRTPNNSHTHYVI